MTRSWNVRVVGKRRTVTSKLRFLKLSISGMLLRIGLISYQLSWLLPLLFAKKTSVDFSFVGIRGVVIALSILSHFLLSCTENLFLFTVPHFIHIYTYLSSDECDRKLGMLLAGPCSCRISSMLD